jgi:hypothetical protein
MNAVFTRILRQRAKESSRLLRFKYTILLGAFHAGFACDSAPALSQELKANHMKGTKKDSLFVLKTVCLFSRQSVCSQDSLFILKIHI